jgi:hypothetical protein
MVFSPGEWRSAMSEGQTVWTILWERAGQRSEPFEIAEVAPRVAQALGIAPKEAERKIELFVNELARMPDGEQYFRREGNALVPLEEFASAPKDSASVLRAYPFEL